MVQRKIWDSRSFPYKTPCWNELWLPCGCQLRYVLVTHIQLTLAQDSAQWQHSTHIYEVHSLVIIGGISYAETWKIQPLKSRVPTWEERDAGCSCWCAGNPLLQILFLSLESEKHPLGFHAEAHRSGRILCQFPERKSRHQSKFRMKDCFRTMPEMDLDVSKSENEIK